MIPAVDTEDDSADLNCMCCSSTISVTESVGGMYCDSDKYVNIVNIFLTYRIACWTAFSVRETSLQRVV
jgi:hypothetical protein